MKQIKQIFRLLVIWLIISLFTYLGYLYGLTRIPKIRDFQRLIKCSKIDGVLGKETQLRWQNAYYKQTGKWMY